MSKIHPLFKMKKKSKESQKWFYVCGLVSPFNMTFIISTTSYSSIYVICTIMCTNTYLITIYVKLLTNNWLDLKPRFVTAKISFFFYWKMKKKNKRINQLDFLIFQDVNKSHGQMRRKRQPPGCRHHNALAPYIPSGRSTLHIE